MRKQFIENIENTLQEKDKRRNRIEKAQLMLAKNDLVAVCNFLDRDDIMIDSSHTDEMRKMSNRVFMDENGKIRWVSDGYKNTLRDSKLFDLYVPVIIKGKIFTIYFMLKGTPGRGGSQDCSIREMISLSKLIQKSKEKNVHFIFMLDGEYA